MKPETAELEQDLSHMLSLSIAEKEHWRGHAIDLASFIEKSDVAGITPLHIRRIMKEALS